MKALKKTLLVFSALQLLSIYSYSQFVYNWFPVSSGTSNTLNYTNQNWIAGANGTILYTSNSGNNWNNINSTTSAELKCIAVQSSTVIAVGSGGVVIKSTDLGANWQQITSGTTASLNSITRNSGTNYVSVGNSGVIIYSSNTGSSWQAQISGITSNLNSVFGLVYNNWAVGNNGVIIATTNYGANWNLQQSGVTDNLNSVEFSGLTTGWAVGNNGRILKTTNGGVNWVLQTSGTTQNLNSLKILSGIILAAGNNSTVLKSTDGGSSWSQLTGTGLPVMNINSAAIVNTEQCWVVGAGGSIYKRRVDSLYLPYAPLKSNDINTWFSSRGIFNQDIRTPNTPGFEWPAGTGKSAIFTSGLTTAAYVNGSIRMAAASYNGEYKSGYVLNGSFATDNRFRIYRVKRGDTYLTNQNWNEWGNMVPYGAPYQDLNNNGVYDPQSDIPGVKDAKETIFMCITDADPASHTPSEGFGGGTAPLFAEVHLTAWGYDNPGYENIQFMKWVVVNKGLSSWDSTIFSIVSDPDLGDAEDDYIGCDTIRNMGYCYNADNMDGDGSGRTYGANPPAVGMMFLNCSGSNSGLTTLCYFTSSASPGPPCERDPGNTSQAYNYMKGIKNDGTSWVIPNTNPPQVTKFTYSGDPETSVGWTSYNGNIENCNGSLTGTHTIPAYPGDKRFLMSYRPAVTRINPGDSQVIMAAQLINRGNNNLNSVTRLKELSDVAKNLCQNGFVIGINPISSEIPNRYSLHQNYPNPFNPVTKIKFGLPKSGNVIIKIYDAIGREITTLVNEKLNAGVYSVDWNGANYPSGVYFCQLTSGSFTETKKMVLIK
jgi:photosystem II stability/assembly factor-like uncharacterized protein